jgi:hypothetical protein
MGLMDVLQGMANGPRGGQTAQPGRSGISPLAMGLIAMLAYKTMKGEGPLGGLFGNRPAQGTAPQPTGSGGGGLMSAMDPTSQFRQTKFRKLLATTPLMRSRTRSECRASSFFSV